ncbi:hypothetical protein SLITO_v1c05910 [Spiroplasma litorale]|uniref:Carbohydrate kinase PfkB domain-containing protein n=1 Tax=Spiroplasma litorale TaxID=216942 RepID=A0A0K1W1M8_9MOLU|nr:PfkB family carbohydrate kinase [Spiroplasma litorale]AKX34225.1 hypothetical protein SLITO_v1c05910 [Spiroplasma litorale]
MKVLVIGAAIVDIIMYIDKLPKSGSDVLCKNNEFRVGGCAFNVSKVLKNENINFDLFSPVGKGIVANYVKEELDKNKYNNFVVDQSQDNGYCLTLVENNGERTFVTSKGIEKQFKKKWFNKYNLNKYEYIYFEGYRMSDNSGDLIISELENYKDKKFIFCPGPNITNIDNDLMNRIMKLKPIIHLNKKELLEYSKTDDILIALKDLYQKSNNAIIVTLGSEGSSYYNNGEYLEFKISNKTKIYNTTGAGDTHIGLIISWLINKNNSFNDAVEYANKNVIKYII